MQDNTSSVSDAKAAGTRVVALGIAAVVLILGSTATFLLWRLPAADAFNNRVERLFIENTYLTSEEEI